MNELAYVKHLEQCVASNKPSININYNERFVCRFQWEHKVESFFPDWTEFLEKMTESEEFRGFIKRRKKRRDAQRRQPDEMEGGGGGGHWQGALHFLESGGVQTRYHQNLKSEERRDAPKMGAGARSWRTILSPRI